ncbi:hypothetical protein [Rhizomonospora bruguierae]|uniref:hypothetical protein n=1 Tax=Rhizomonospora bruguierae TaxID=1581705 RepID=UPI001BCF16CB|nr:hypothetical protein [Micromonospora sp. NBRC 107566]
MAENNPTPWRRRAARSEVEASTGTSYWTVDPPPPAASGPPADLVAPPILVGAFPVRPEPALVP